MNWVNSEAPQLFACVSLSHVPVKECHAPCHGKIPLQALRVFSFKQNPAVCWISAKQPRPAKHRTRLGPCRGPALERDMIAGGKHRPLDIKSMRRRKEAAAATAAALN